MTDQPDSRPPDGPGGYPGPHQHPGPQYASPPYPGPPYASPPYASPSYASPQYPGPPYPAAYPGPPYLGTPPAVAETPAQTIVLLVLSGITVLSCYFAVTGIAPLVLSIVALTRHRTDPDGARRLTRIGWWVGGGGLVLVVLAIAAIVVVSVLTEP